MYWLFAFTKTVGYESSHLIVRFIYFFVNYNSPPTIIIFQLCNILEHCVTQTRTKKALTSELTCFIWETWFTGSLLTVPVCKPAWERECGSGRKNTIGVVLWTWHPSKIMTILPTNHLLKLSCSKHKAQYIMAFMPPLVHALAHAMAPEQCI